MLFRANDFANLLLRFVSGMTMQLQVSWNATMTPGWTLEAFGSKWRFVARAPNFPTSRDTTLHAGALGGPAFGPVTIAERLLKTPDVALDSVSEPTASHPLALSLPRPEERRVV